MEYDQPLLKIIIFMTALAYLGMKVLIKMVWIAKLIVKRALEGQIGGGRRPPSMTTSGSSIAVLIRITNVFILDILKAW